jgi:hypothetical protein
MIPGESTYPPTLHSDSSENSEGNEENDEEDRNAVQEDQCTRAQEFPIPIKVPNYLLPPEEQEIGAEGQALQYSLGIATYS